MYDDLHDIKLPLRVRLASLHDARKKRRFLCKQFCFKLGIDYPPHNVADYKLPKDYTIITPRIEEIGVQRDRIILTYLKTYQEQDSQILQKIENCQNELCVRQEHIRKIKQQLSSAKQKLKRIAKPNQYIGQQNNIFLTQNKITNLEFKRSIIKEKMIELIQARIEAAQHFLAQKEVIDKLIEKHLDRYILSATKQIQAKTHFTSFRYDTPAYNPSISEALKQIDKLIKKESKNGKKK